MAGTGWDSPDLAKSRSMSAGIAAASSASQGWRPSEGKGYTPAKDTSFQNLPGGGFSINQGNEEGFDLGQASKAFGFSSETPTGYEFPTGSWDAFADFVQQQYNMSPQDFMESDPESRYEAWAEPRGIATKIEDIEVGESGMPMRPPKSPEEAAMFQFLAGERTREKNESMLANAVATIQHAIGLLRRGGKGAAAVAQSPMLGQLSDIYRTTQYTEPDYSYWLLPEAKGQG